MGPICNPLTFND
jgi:hypothetical protein